MFKRIIVVAVVVLGSIHLYAQESKELMIKTISEVNDHMSTLSFSIVNEIEAKELKEFVASSKEIEIIKDAKVDDKKNKEITWVFNQTPTLGNFKLIFATLNIQQVILNGKTMSAVDFTTFGFTNSSSTK